MSREQPRCRSCNEPMDLVGSFYYCASTECDDYAKPMGEDRFPAVIPQADGDHSAALILVDHAGEGPESEDEIEGEDGGSFTRTEYSPSYRAQMIDAGRGHLLP